MEEDMLYRLALTKVSGIGPVFARKLIRHFGEARPVFLAGKPELEEICGEGRANAVVNFNGFREAEKELSFLEKYSMQPLFITDKNYPRRLLDCEDMPVLLFYKGSADLNVSRVVAIIGTRSPTQYGKQATQRLVSDLATSSEMLIISGLAHGIDSIAHQAALDHDLPTVGILGHGLDRIYPQQNTSLAKKMVRQGGLLTKFNINTIPETHNFPVRNRMVAGLSDALIVVETDIRGGSMLTVSDALDYKKKIFALPGRINDIRSAGCNTLIRKGKATLLVNAGQLLEDLQWATTVTRPASGQATLFSAPTDESNLSENERKMLHLIRERKNPTFDELYSAMVNGPGRSELTLDLLNLELKGWIHSLPGRVYRLCI